MTMAETPAPKTAARTPAEHRAKAESDLRFMNNYGPGDAAYHGYALSAIARLFAVLVAYLEPQPLPQVPGLPPGWRIETRQNETGERKWAYMLWRDTPPATIGSRYLWNTSEGALGEGIRHAATRQAQDDAPGTSGRPENPDQGGVAP